MNVLGVTSWVGTFPTWAILLLGLLFAYRITKGGGGSAVSELSKANEVLTKRVHELGAEVRDLRVENEGLKSRTDFAQALAPVLAEIAASALAATDRQTSIMTAQASHEERAQERHTKTLLILDRIAERLGPSGH